MAELETEQTRLEYLLKRRSHVRIFIGLAAFAVLFFLVAAALFVTKTITVNHRYAVLTGIADSTDYESKRTSYIAAIKLCPQRTTAYGKLLEAYEQNGRFDMEESAEFTSLYNSARMLWKEKGGGELAYLAGRMYFGLYTENGEHVSMSARVQRAASYFAGATENSPEDEATAKVAGCYNTICQYYKQYILASSDKRELTDEAVASLFEQARSALDAIQSGTEYDRLNLASAICNLIYDQRTEFARVSLGRGEEALALLSDAFNLAENTNVSRSESVSLKNMIIGNKDAYIDGTRYAFTEKENNQ